MKRTLVVATLAVLSPLAALACAASAGRSGQTEPTRRERQQARRQARQQDAAEWRRAWGGLAAEDRARLADAWRGALERVERLTPEERRRLVDGAERIAQELRARSQHNERLQDWLQQSAAAYAALTAEQKQAIFEGLADTVERLRRMTPEQKESVKALYRRLLGL